ncbi:MAG: carboxymuconolactone decarboxylase family protein [Gemmatimonadota bacterium]|nr:carboxymuconolactone decarboxylase family protein [Gemmatimonadota bacterium]
MAHIDYHAERPTDHILRISTVNPEVLRSHLQLYRHLVKGPSPLSRTRREMIAVAVSQINDCHY